MLRRFYGGLHLNDEKGATHRLASVRLDPPPEQVVLPLRMHACAPCSPCVSKGDRVQVGQVVATPIDCGTPIHASVSGTVAAIEPRACASGEADLSVVIQNDCNDTRVPALPRLPFYEELMPDEIVRRVEEAGVVGMDNGLPACGSIRSALGRADTLIINAAECEPYLTADHRLMLESPEAVLTGIRILMRALGLNRAFLGVQGNKTSAISVLHSLLPLRGSDITIKILPVRYPQGAQRQLVQRLTGRLVAPNEQPIDAGCAVFHVAAAAAIQAAVVEGRALTERIVTVAGDGVARPGNFLVPIGTPAVHLLECAGGLTKKTARLLFGGPMTGAAQLDLNAPVMKHTCAVLALTDAKLAPQRAPSACIRCGKCASVCPMRLLPLHLHQLAQAGRYDALSGYHLADCMECGACAYLCPARIPLTQSIRESKARIQAAGKEAGEHGG